MKLLLLLVNLLLLIVFFRVAGMVLVTELCEEGRLLKYLQAGGSWIRETCEVIENYLCNARCYA